MKRGVKLIVRNPFEESQNIALQFDDATLSNDIEKLRELITTVEQELKSQNIFFKAHMYYSLATATDTISRLSNKSANDRKIAIKKQLSYYRKALKIINLSEFNDPKIMQYTRPLQACILTNYGNTLIECGRRISAIDQYISAQGYYPFFAMSMGNLGLCYMEYAALLNDGQGYIRDCLNHYAYVLLSDAIKSNDPNIHDEAKMYFVSALSRFDIDYREYLSNFSHITTTPKMSKKEEEYRRWCIDRHLFLSPLNDLYIDDLAFAEDDIYISGILTSLEEKMPVVFGMFNQLKQEYVSARLFYFESQNQTAKPHFSDRRTHLTETLDYAQFSLRVEKLKTSFKMVYGILDKIAYFLNSYFDLGIKEKDITFSSVWKSEKSGHNGYSYKNVLNIENNFPLASLYWISQDFDEKLGEDSNPELKRLREIRNFLEHKYTIVAWNYNADDPFQSHPSALYLDENELNERTLELFKVVREAIICLSLCVNTEESRKRKELSDNTIVAKMQIGIHEDRWKI